MAEEVGQAYVSLIPSARGFSRAARRELKLALATVEGTVKLKPDVDSAKAAAAGREASVIANEAAGPIRLQVSVLRGDLIAAGRRITRTITSITTAALRTAGYGLAAGAASVAVVGLTSATASLIPVLFGLGKVMIAATGVTLALPGAIGVAVIAISALKIGLVGLKDTFKAIVDGDAAKFDEALKKLSPNARAFAREVMAMRPAFKALQLGVQNQLFLGLDLLFRRLAVDLLPLANRGFSDMAATINSRVVRAVVALDTATNRLALKNIFTSANLAMGNLLTTLRPVGQAILDLLGASIKLGAGLSGGVADSVSQLATRLSAFSKSDRFKETFLAGVDAAKLFLGLGKDLIGIFSGLGRAAGASNGLFSFFTRLNKLINSADVQASLTGVFSELGRLGQVVEPVFSALARALVPVARGIADVAVAFSPHLVTLFDALGPALGSLAPALSALAPVASALALALGPIADILSRLVVAAAPGFVQFINGLATGLAPLAAVAPIVGKALGDLFAALGPVAAVLGNALALALGAIAPTLSNLLVAFTPLLQVVATMAEVFTTALLPAINDVVTANAPLIAVLGQLMANALVPLIPIIAQVGQIFASELVKAAPKVFAMFSQLIPVVAQLAQIFADNLVSVFQTLIPQLPELIAAGLNLALAFGNLLIALIPLLPALLRVTQLALVLLLNSGALQALIVGLTAAINSAALVITVFGFALSFVVGLITGAIGAVTGLALGVLNMVDGVISAVTGLAGRILSAVANFGSLLYDAGRSIVKGLVDGIVNALPLLGDAASRMASKVRNFLPFSPAKEGPLSGSGSPFVSGQAIATNLAAGVHSALPTVAGAADRLAGAFGPGGTGAGATGASAGAATGVEAHWAAGATGDRLLDALRELIGFRYGGDPDNALATR